MKNETGILFDNVVNWQGLKMANMLHEHTCSSECDLSENRQSSHKHRADLAMQHMYINIRNMNEMGMSHVESSLIC